MRRLLSLVALGLLVIGCGGTASPAPAERTITGEVRLNNGDTVLRSDGDCQGTGGFDDINVATQAVVKNDAGTIVGTTRLEAAPIVDTTDRRERYLSKRRCDYTFTVVVPDSPFYSIEVGRRGALTYSRPELEDAGWAVEMSIGDEEQ